MGKVNLENTKVHIITPLDKRKGLNVGGTKEALFVIATDVETNTIYTGQRKSSPGLFRKTLL